MQDFVGFRKELDIFMPITRAIDSTIGRLFLLAPCSFFFFWGGGRLEGWLRV